MYPSKEAKELLEVVETEDRLKVMKKMYTAVFSDEGFEDFCKNRYPLSIISAAEEAHCKIQVNKIELLKEASDTDNAYYYKASFLLDEKMPVSQNVIVCYENKKITKKFPVFLSPDGTYFFLSPHPYPGTWHCTSGPWIFGKRKQGAGFCTRSEAESAHFRWI